MIVGIDPSLTSTGLFLNDIGSLVKSKPSDDPNIDPVLATIARCNRIMDDIDTALLLAGPHDGAYNFVIEGPAFFSGRQASHLFEMGIWYACFHQRFHGPPNTIMTVNPATLKKFISGKGNTKGDQIPLIIYKKYGVEFPKDPTHDIAHAFALEKIGHDILEGRYALTTQRRRTSGRKGKSVTPSTAGYSAV